MSGLEYDSHSAMPLTALASAGLQCIAVGSEGAILRNASCGVDAIFDTVFRNSVRQIKSTPDPGGSTMFFLLGGPGPFGQQQHRSLSAGQSKPSSNSRSPSRSYAPMSQRAPPGRAKPR
jgi:hypothetical protein